MIVKKSVTRRFWVKVEKTDSCWLWTAARLSGSGYGLFRLGGRGSKNVIAHRFSYRLLVGEIPEGLTLDHLCRNRACVNPAHLEPVTLKENILRGEGVTAQNARRTHCSKGHRFDIALSNGWRVCRECKNERNRAYSRRKKEKALGMV